MFSLSPPIAVALGVLLLFGVLVLLRFTSALLREARALARSLEHAERTVRTAIASIDGDVRTTQDRLEELRAGVDGLKRPARRRRAASGVGASGKVYDAREEHPLRD